METMLKLQKITAVTTLHIRCENWTSNGLTEIKKTTFFKSAVGFDHMIIK